MIRSSELCYKVRFPCNEKLLKIVTGGENVTVAAGYFLRISWPISSVSTDIPDGSAYGNKAQPQQQKVRFPFQVNNPAYRHMPYVPLQENRSWPVWHSPYGCSRPHEYSRSILCSPPFHSVNLRHTFLVNQHKHQHTERKRNYSKCHRHLLCANTHSIPAS